MLSVLSAISKTNVMHDFSRILVEQVNYSRHLEDNVGNLKIG